jgi:peroxiredoxin
MTLQIGQAAPAFSLYDTNKQLVSLESFQGKRVVLVFFPLAFTGVCTTELCSLRDNIAQYNDLNAEVLGISVDSLFSLDKFKSEQGINFTLLSDFNKEAAIAYDCLYNEFVLGMKGVAKRSVFVIDEAGKLMHAEVLEDAGKIPDFEAVVSALKA